MVEGPRSRELVGRTPLGRGETPPDASPDVKKLDLLVSAEARTDID